MGWMVRLGNGLNWLRLILTEAHPILTGILTEILTNGAVFNRFIHRLLLSNILKINGGR